VPERVTAKLRIERSGRKGKTVTVVDGLPRNQGFLQDLAKELKTACGTGGTALEDRVEVQGDHRDKVRDRLRGKGWTVKG
jgi:translation initiation factor 1